MTRLLFAGVIAIGMLFPAVKTDAQSAAMDQLYGQGVHAYHSGQLQEAMDAFTTSIRMGTRDPRVYYFRGLAQAAMGSIGSSDFQIGAQLEASSTGRYYSVGRALERVQGATRLEIESARRNARLLVRQQQSYPGAPGNVVDQSQPVIPDPLERGTIAPVQTNFPDVSGVQNPGTPFADSPATEAATPPAMADPFPGESSPTPTDTDPPMEELDPFGSDPGTDPPTEEPPPVEEDPFGSDPPMEEPPPVEEDPFGSDPPMEETPPVEEDPFGADPPMEETPPVEEDPFGSDPPTEETPPVEEDPFAPGGDEESDDVPPPPADDAEDDPFAPDDSGDGDADEGTGEEGDDADDDKDGDKSPPDDPFG